MYPVIFEIGPIKIYSFGLMLVTAFYTCYGLLYLEMKRLKYDTEIASDIIFWSAVGGVLGAKIYYLIENLDRTIQDPMGMIFSGSGLVFLGGLIVAITNIRVPWSKNACLLYFYSSIGIFGGMLLSYMAAKTVPSGIISLMFGLAPILSGLLAQQLLNEPKFSPIKLVWILQKIK